jgi:hypothetical protein
MATKIPTWAWVVIGVVALCILGMLAIAGMGVYFVTRQVETMAASPARAEETFERERAQFQDQKPLIELDEDDRIVRRNVQAPAAGEPRKVETLTVLAWDADDERLIRIDLPFWLLRLKKDPLDVLADRGIHGNRLRLTVQDLERMGPRLILDHRGRRGERVLVWTH